ncbi:hypothetical protein LCGC14_1792030 [marine sediment metagenome]|uniref:Uncharacterized protein n=1 Tax=marine sediment metagenome TaxID=412755 RepID=A0A0F9HEU3_9ZZZZ
MFIIWWVYYKNTGFAANWLLPALLVKTSAKKAHYLYPVRWFLQPAYLAGKR